MSILKKRSTAALAAVIVIIFGTLFGVHRSVNAETAKIEKLFYDGVTVTDSMTGSTYKQPAIQAQLDKRATAALGLVTVASNYPDLAEQVKALRAARQELLDASEIPQKYAANEKLQTAYQKLYTALSRHLLKDNEKASSASYAETLDGAQGVIGKSAYNSQVAEYMKTLSGFPVSILKIVAFAHYPGAFGAEG